MPMPPKRKIEVVLEGEDKDVPMKPPPSFNGALSKFVFSSGAPSGVGAFSTGLRSSPRIAVKRALTVSIKPEPKPKPGPKTKTKAAKTSMAAAVATPNTSSETEAAAAAPKKKRRRPPSVYAPPSTYAYLSPIPDALAPNLILIFIGINPGLTSARTGHAFASPTNLFYRLLHASGCTDVRVPPAQDQELPARYGVGHTNLVPRPSRDAGELSREEMVAGVGALKKKVGVWRPEAVCFVGKMAWEAVVRSETGRGVRSGWEWGWQRGAREKWGCEVFVVPSTSGLVAGYSWEFKKELWSVLGGWVGERRKMRGEGGGPIVEGRTKVEEEEKRDRV